MNSTDRVARIENASPEQRLIAAQILDAEECCRAGCTEACEWLMRRASDYLVILTPPDRDVEALVAKLATEPEGQQQLWRY